MVTAETAVVAPFVAAALAGAVWLASLGVAQSRATDAAREAARAIARGESEGSATATARDVAAENSRVEIDVEGERVRVEVHTPAQLPLFGGIGTTVSAVAVGRIE
ncbi:pilus assembly protein [Aeromicrobium camelliae]|uniref:Pilus assembly protein n=1 Tax=Aeromicrobium camelliae TaxID=1538144 RepID=A0A3N6X3M2_9ACTN|nr:TadE family type IV pilus minor pilin [Aeromicrobium camelliae]RQN08233.1 pilus assembly protein [Aeromicrobium camelliae]